MGCRLLGRGVAVLETKRHCVVVGSSLCVLDVSRHGVCDRANRGQICPGAQALTLAKSFCT